MKQFGLNRRARRILALALGFGICAAPLAVQIPGLEAPISQAAPVPSPELQISSIGMAMSNPSTSVINYQGRRVKINNCTFAGLGTDYSTITTKYGWWETWSSSKESWVDVRPGQNTNEWSYISHGVPGGWGGCPRDMSISDQSAIGVQPHNPGSVRVGETFYIGRIRHSNNPLNAPGGSDYRINGEFQISVNGKIDSFPWEQQETPNSCYFKVDSDQEDCADDILTIQKDFSRQIHYDINGVRYYLNIWGFIKEGSEGCPANPQLTEKKTKFITSEGRATNSCIYASFNQERKVKIAKVVKHGPGVSDNYTIPAVNFDVSGINHPSSNFNLRPSNWNEEGKAIAGARDEITYMVELGDVNVHETLPPDGQNGEKWKLESIKCADSRGREMELPAGSVDLEAGTINLDDLGLAATAADQNYTCTFYNYLEAPADKRYGKLKINKTVTGDKDGLKNPEQSFNFSYTCKMPEGDKTTLPTDVKMSGEITVKAGEFSEVEKIPVGASCTINEGDLDKEWLKSEDYHWETPVINPSEELVVSQAGQAVEFNVENKIRYEKPVPPSKEITIRKIGTMGPLDGAKFALYDTDPSAEGAKPIPDAILTGDTTGVFKSIPVESEKTYWLVETVAPFGHQLLPVPVKFELTPTGLNLAGQGEGEQASLVVSKTGDFEITVKDTEVGVLPESGGEGWMPYALGGFILAGLGVLISRRTRQNKIN
ncbi:choice-of-anchor K domain-containing protein [Actinomycetaceae bacterium TAE3-ERU4]|nr:choice-of-anchor K domain-containing protein [Actinomycetaceae bacterium TAE3-ERU4]